MNSSTDFICAGSSAEGKKHFRLQPALRVMIVAGLNLGPLVLGAMPDAMDQNDPRVAVVLMAKGKAYATVNAATPEPLKLGQVLPPGTTIQTARGSEAVLYFRQIGSLVRLSPQSCLTLEKMMKHQKEDVLVKETVLDLQQGRLLCVVRVLVPESRFQVKIPGYLATQEGPGIGRYDIRAKGTILVGKKSAAPLRVTPISQSVPMHLVAPGQRFGVKNLRIEAIDPKILAELMPQFDELRALAEGLTPPPRPDELKRTKETPQ